MRKLTPVLLSALLVSILFSCVSNKPQPDPVHAEIKNGYAKFISIEEMELGWDVVIHNTSQKPVEISEMVQNLVMEDHLFSIEEPSIMPGIIMPRINPGESVNIPFTVIVPLPREQKMDDELTWNEEDAWAIWEISLAYTAVQAKITRNLGASAAFTAPRLGKPGFSVLSIIISQDDLVNTRLLIELSILNPNIFPIELSAFNYELFGEGRRWAGGSLKTGHLIPPMDKKTVNLGLSMNFTQMNRQILDQVIKLELLKYRFLGDASVLMDKIPPYTQSFDLSGITRVSK